MSAFVGFKSKTGSEDAIAVVIGKTFESTTLPDGTQQITEVTKYKRLNDGFIYTESKLRQVIDEEDDDIENNPCYVNNSNSFPSPRKSLRISSSPANNTTAKKIEILKQDSFSNLICPSSSTLTTSSYSVSSGTREPSFIDTVPTEDHDDEFLRGEEFVEEFLYDKDASPQTPLTPKDDTNGWSAKDDEDEVNSIQIIKSKIPLWSPRRIVRKIGQLEGRFNGLQAGREDGDNDDKKGSSTSSTTCRERVYSRNSKMMITSVLIILIIIVSVSLLSPSRKAEKSSAKDGRGGTISDEDAEDGVDCINIKIIINTDENTGENGVQGEGDQSEWELIRKQTDSSRTIASSKSLGPNQSYTIEKCVPPGMYTFHLTDSGGDGLGEGGQGGYYIIANGIELGISSFFFHDEQMTFSLPFGGDEYDGDYETTCADDFFLAIATDGSPQETTWDVVDNNNRQVVLNGGPYSTPWAVYTKRACLKDGNYTLTMHDAGKDGMCCQNGQGFYVLYNDGKKVADSDGKFGDSDSTIFLLGGNPPQEDP